MEKQLRLLILSLVVTFPPLLSQSSSTTTDGRALLRFKKGITLDPAGVFSNWREDRDPCGWDGITCTQGMVTQIDLSRFNLAGRLSFGSLAPLAMLTVLNLSSNSFPLNISPGISLLPRGLKRLDLSSSGLFGPIPDNFRSSYPNLTYLNLSHNNLSGHIPDNLLGMSCHLRVPDPSRHELSCNISSFCSANSLLDLSGNRFTGPLPGSTSNCTGLTRLNLSSNGFIGGLPRSLGELRGLEVLDLSNNHLSSELPSDLLDKWSNTLVELNLSNNNFSGPVPHTLGSCPSLRSLDLSGNRLSGPLPDDAFANLTSLETLSLRNNFLTGELPSSLSACGRLRVAEFGSNRFTGRIPAAGICPGAKSLEEFRVPDNAITGEIPRELAGCERLRVIDVSVNGLSGSIPWELGRLANLERFMAWFNRLTGEIPRELRGSCGSLKDLILNNNFLSGSIPVELFDCTGLEWISLTSNRLSGPLPPEIGRLPRLAVLQLGNNSLTGRIPTKLGNCSSLVWLDLNSNKLTGGIPPRLGRQLGAPAPSGILSGNTLAFVRNVGNSCRGVGGLLEFSGIRPERLLQVPTLKSCDFARLYSGAALTDWTRDKTLEYLDLSYNDLRGSIPEELGGVVSLQVLDLAHNRLTGLIPPSLGQLRNLGVFDAANNTLSGSIPWSFSNLSFLVQIDVSNNNLSGEIPSRGQLSTLPASQFAGNPGLCGVPLPPCWPKTNPSPRLEPHHGDPKATSISKASSSPWANSTVLGILIPSVSVCVLIVAWVVIAMHLGRRDARATKVLGSLKPPQSATTWIIENEREPLSINVATFQRQLRKLTFSQLVEATNGFSNASLIGYGGFGEVFKATLKDGSCVAIKKLVRLSCQGDREFAAEMETLGKIKHGNLVPLLGYCKVGEERLLVYEYMEFGSLEDALHGKNGTEEAVMGWDTRKRILKGAARGLCFLHHDCIPHIIHRDMKSSNVLLDGEMEARVSDFGMARLISALDTHLSVSNLAGTPGYVPPEYYQSFRCTAKGDVYSFGVVLLEILTGRRPTDKEDFGDTNLVGWVRMRMKEGRMVEVVDPDMLASSGEDEAKEMVKCLQIAMRCVDDFPSKRPNMLEVASLLKELKPVEAQGC